MQSVLFVCLGNICRSPAAHAIFQKLIIERGVDSQFTIDSAGTYGGHAGQLPDQRMREAGAKRGYIIDSPSRKLIADDFEKFDHILVMDDMNYEKAHRIAPTIEGANKIGRMRDYCLKTGVSFVPDPYYEGREGFERVLDILEDGCNNLLDELISL